MKNKDVKNGVIFNVGDENKAFEKYFIGKSYLNMLCGGEGITPIGNVTFEPGCRNNWHKHPGGQILLVTGGEGWYQEEGKDAQSLKPGDVVVINRNVKHWHGAKKDSWFTHLAIENDVTAGPSEWCEPVSDEEYSKL